jgi:AbrB family looped-hinge helix DNA binding protein
MHRTIDRDIVLQPTDRWSDAMSMVTVSPKYQVVIPKEIRERMDIKPGQQVQMMIYKGNLVLVPLRPIEEMRGFAKGIAAEFERDEDRL